MKSFFSADFLIFSIAVIILCVGRSNCELEQAKNRRGGTAGLFAFPRVGRSDPNLMNNHDSIDAAIDSLAYPASLEDYEEYSQNEMKRHLKPFARVGRNSEGELRKWAHLLALQQALDKRTGPSATSGLWFGPRLGKRSVDANEHKHHESKGQKEKY